MAKAQNVPIIVLKKSLSNYVELVEALEAYVISSIEDLDGANFFNFLVKTKLPKLNTTCSHLFTKLVSLVTKS